MKALVLSEPGKIEIKEVQDPILKPGQALVRIKAASLNHRDQWCREGKYPNINYGVTLGSDGAGVVTKVSEASNSYWLDKEVVINPNINWGSDPEVQSSAFKILGMPENGTFAEYVAVDSDRLYEKPKHLDFNAAAALPLAGLTAYRAVFRYGKVASGKNVLISGVGGGVAQFAFLFSKAAGANVYVTSGSPEKIQLAKEMGALDGYNYKEEDWSKKALKDMQGFDVIVDSAGGNQLNKLISITKPAGSIVFYGATTGLPASINLHRMFWNQIKLQGSTMGNDEEFKEMLAFISKFQLTPVIDSVRPFNKIVAAFDAMEAGKQSGKLVVSL